MLVVAFNRALTYATQCALDDLIREDQYGDHLPRSGREPPSRRRATAAEQATSTFFNQQVPEALAILLRDAEHDPELAGTHWWWTKPRIWSRPGCAPAAPVRDPDGTRCCYWRIPPRASTVRPAMSSASPGVWN